MTVNPGAGGQAFIPAMLPKIAALRQRCAALGLTPHIEVDGGQNDETIRQCHYAGADVIVAGSAIFGTADYAATVANMRRAVGAA